MDSKKKKMLRAIAQCVAWNETLQQHAQVYAGPFGRSPTTQRDEGKLGIVGGENGQPPQVVPILVFFLCPGNKETAGKDIEEKKKILPVSH